MGNVGMPELIVIAAVLVIFVGPDRLPGMARDVARFVAKLRRSFGQQVNDLKDMEELKELRELRQELRGVKGDLGGVARDVVRGRQVGQGSVRPDASPVADVSVTPPDGDGDAAG